MASAGPLQLHLDNTLGAAYIGNIVTAIFYGVTNVQTYIYYTRNPGDGMYMKTTVFVLWILDGLHLALISHTMYFYTVTNFADPFAIINITWSILLHIIVCGISDTFVRGIFTHRVWKLSGKNWFLTAVIAIATLVTLIGNLAFAIKGFSLKTYLNLPKVSWILYTSFGAGVVSDVSIAVALCYLLRKRRTGFKRTDSVVRMLITYSINTGVLTSLCAVSCLVTYVTMPNNFIFIAFYFLLPKLFLNSLLATLNARQTLRENTTEEFVSIPLSTSVSSRGGVEKGENSQVQSHPASAKLTERNFAGYVYASQLPIAT